jgi:hypothetical protein
MAQSYSELRITPTDELIRTYDKIAPNTVLGLNFYSEEIARRDAAEQTAKITKMTQQMRDLTIVIAVLTLVNAVLVAVSLFR